MPFFDWLPECALCPTWHERPKTSGRPRTAFVGSFDARSWPRNNASATRTRRNLSALPRHPLQVACQRVSTLIAQDCLLNRPRCRHPRRGPSPLRGQLGLSARFLQRQPFTRPSRDRLPCRFHSSRWACSPRRRVKGIGRHARRMPQGRAAEGAGAAGPGLLLSGSRDGAGFFDDPSTWVNAHTNTLIHYHT